LIFSKKSADTQTLSGSSCERRYVIGNDTKARDTHLRTPDCYVEPLSWQLQKQMALTSLAVHWLLQSHLSIAVSG